MITGGKTDIDGALAIMATEFTKNINTIIEDVKAVLEKEDITSFHKDDEGDIKIDISFVQKPMDNIGYITNIIMLLLEAKKSIPGNDAEDDWYGKLCDEQDQIEKKYNEITSYIKNVSNDIMIDELITADYIQGIGEKLIGISDYIDLNENLLFNDKADDDDDVSSGGNSNPDESKTYQLNDEVINIKEEKEITNFKQNMFKMFDDVDNKLQLIISVSELLSNYMNEQRLDINNFDIQNAADEFLMFREELQGKMKELGLEISSKYNEYTLKTFRSSYNYLETQKNAGNIMGGLVVLHDIITLGIFDDDIKWSDDGTKVVFPKVKKLLEDYGHETKGNAMFRDGYKKAMDNICQILNYIFRQNSCRFNSYWAVVLASWGFEFSEVDNDLTNARRVSISQKASYTTVLEDFHHPGGLFNRNEPFKAQLMRPVSQHVNKKRRIRSNMLVREEQIRHGIDVCGTQCTYKDEGNQCENRVATVPISNNPWIVYECCPIHIGHDEKIANSIFSKERHAEAQARIDELAEKGKQWKDAYKSEQDKLPEIQYRSTEEIFGDPQVQQIWNQRDALHHQSISAINKIISPVSRGLKITQFHDDINNPDDKVRKRKTRLALQRLIQFLTVCCEECKELVPGWKIDNTENGKCVVADLEFSDPGRFYGNHFDHFLHNPEGDKYIRPGQLVHYNAKRAKNQLCITGTKCTGCHEFGDKDNRKLKIVNKHYETNVWCQPTTEQVGIDKILASEGFKNLQKMIDDNNLEYGGRTPLKTLQEVKTLFAECTGGKDLKDYVTWAEEPDFWECRNNNRDAMACVNELRLNYIKKESKCCAGNKNHREKCNRDIQNVIPYRLSMFHFDHGINKEKKKFGIADMVDLSWKRIENELKVIENVKCAWCHANE